MKYLKFLLKSSNQHGVHSPFVYSLVTKCFYKKKKRSLEVIANKKTKLLIDLINYFTPKTALVLSNSKNLDPFLLALKQLNSTLIKTDKSVKNIPTSKKIDFIYFDDNKTKETTLAYFKTCLQTKQNNSVWVFNAIYSNKEMQETWAEIKNNTEVTLTVDVFHFGIIFFRKEQAKEDFKIRV